MDRLVLLVLILAYVFFSNDPAGTSREIRLTSVLTGAGEVPGPGDPNGSGKALLTLNPDKGEICFDISVHNIKEATSAHLHEGAAGMSGDVKIQLDAPKSGSSKGCKPVDSALLKTIAEKPDVYYLNIHNADFPNGAIRGQLTK